MEGLTRARNHYDGATRTHRSAGWRAVSTDANAEIRAAGERLRDVARDMCRNNAYARRARDVIVTNTIGSGIIPNIEASRKGTIKKLEELLRAHFDTPACDALGRLDLYGLQAQALACVIESGECLVRYRQRRITDGLPLPFQLQVLEPDYLDTSVDGQQRNGNIAIQGIEYDRLGRVRAYHLFDQHPGSATGGTPQSRPVLARFVTHLFRGDRPGQNRGASWFAPVILRLRDMNDYMDAQLLCRVRAKRQHRSC